MTAQPIQHITPPLPSFEGAPVDSTRLRISGMSQVKLPDELVVSTDDQVRLIGEFRVIGVRHYIDSKSGNLIREQTLSPTTIDIVPWDPTDPDDDGVVRARPRY